MATREWKTLSVKVDEAQKRAIDTICERESITTNGFLSRLVARETEPVLNPNILPENNGLPQAGENRLEYVPESDTFRWWFDTGAVRSAVLSENASPFYLENLKKAIEEGLGRREEFKKKNKGAVIPSKLLRYKVK